MELRVKKHFRRYEVKYLMPESHADKIIPSLLEHMEIDPYTKNKDYYDCYSCYYDTYALGAYRAVQWGLEYRKKLRMRYYDLSDVSGFLEVKRKQGNVIIKDRESIGLEAFRAILRDPSSCYLQKWDNDFTEECLHWLLKAKLEPQVWVKCKRKPFVSSFNSNFRVTIDYDLAFAMVDSVTHHPLDWQKKYEKKVILEAKFTDKMPLWFKNIIDTYKLESQGFSKYCTAINSFNMLKNRII